jgi:hypothetical protein
MFPAVLIAAVLDDAALNSHLPHCIFKYFFNIECWGCGMTRAILELCKFNFDKAITLNPFSPIVLTIIFSIFFTEIFSKGKTKWLNLQ